MTHHLADLLPLAVRAYTRMEAQDLLTRSLREDDPAPLRNLINELLAEERPNLDLLRDLLSDVHARLVQVRERHFDMRRQVVEAFQDGYGIDITPLAPPQGLDVYHRLTTELLQSYLRDNDIQLAPDEELLLKEVFAESVRFAGDLSADLCILESLLEYLDDWIAGFAGLAARSNDAQLKREQFGMLL